MPSPPTSELPKPKSWDEFEDIVADTYAQKFQVSQMIRHGRAFLPQQSVDLYCQPPCLQGRFVGIQCKRVKQLTTQMIDSEADAAQQFEPELAEYFIATTHSRDAKLQKHTRLLSTRYLQEGKFTIGILFWEDICLELSAHPSVLTKYYANDWADALSHKPTIEYKFVTTKFPKTTGLEDRLKAEGYAPAWRDENTVYEAIITGKYEYVEEKSGNKIIRYCVKDPIVNLILVKRKTKNR